MRTLLIIAAVTVAVTQEEAAGKLNDAFKKSLGVKSCEFYVKTETEAVDYPDIVQKPTIFSGKYEAEKGYEGMIAETVPFVRIGDKLAVKDPRDETWKKPEDAITDEQSKKVAAKYLAPLKNIASPTEFFKDMVDGLKEVKEGDKETVQGEECVSYSGTFTDECIKKFATRENRLTGKKTQKNMQPVTAEGKFWLNSDGFVTKIEINAKTTTKVQGEDAEVKVTRTMTFSGHDKTAVEIPEDAKKVLED